MKNERNKKVTKAVNGVTYSCGKIERQADNWRTHLHMPKTVSTIKLFNFEQDLNHGEFYLINRAGTVGALTINT